MIGGVLTATLGWPAVFLINVPLAAVAIIITLTAIPRDVRPVGSRKVDLAGAALLAVGIVALIVGLGQSQTWGWNSLAVWALMIFAAVSAVAFVVVERRRAHPLVDLSLLGTSPGNRTAVISQCIAGAAEMGLGVISPLLLILNLGMPPGVAGLALLPESVPLIFIAPLVGRWYDRAGTRPPMLTGYLLLAASGLFLAGGGFTHNYWLILPGLVLYGGGLAIVLTVNDPVSLSDVPETSHGQAAGVSATAEQFGGALGIAVLYLIFHATYVAQLHAIIDRGPLADLTADQYARLRADIIAAESTGLKPKLFDPLLSPYLDAAFSASAWGYAVTFLAVTVIGIGGSVLAWQTGRARARSSQRTAERGIDT